MSNPNDASMLQALEPEPRGVGYDNELEQLCRIAASVGWGQNAPVSYTALIIAFLFGEDKVSGWFQGYVLERKIHLDEIYRSKKVLAEDRSQHVARANSGELPVASPLFSFSVRNVMEQAANIAGKIGNAPSSTPTLSPCHVMAAYVFRNPSDHKDQVRGWGFEESDWKDQFLQFAEKVYPSEQWSKLNNDIRRMGAAVSSFTADNPLAPVGDFVGVEDEAAAFARIAAARSIQPPLAIGIFGEWGSGKTFFMRRIFENVQALTRRANLGSRTSLFHAEIVQIQFNAWHYIETNLWASLVEYIFAELDQWLLGKTNNERGEADLVFNRLVTAQQLKLDALEGMVARRAERRSAELRAERARREYEEAFARSGAVGFDSYARAFMETLVAQDGVKADLAKIGDALGAPEIAESGGRVIEVLEQARSEVGRTRLILRAGTAKLGTWPWILSIVLALFGIPLTVVAVKTFLASITGSDAIRSIQDNGLALAGLAAAAASCGGVLLRQASQVLRRIDEFDKTLREKVAQQVQELDAAKGPQAAEDELRKRKQALEAAERALADADARLAAARQDFESATARGRLNAFIRAKATKGDYAKHLGIIAAIRRDFGRLAELMGAVSDSSHQSAESKQLDTEAKAGVIRFLKWLEGEPEVRLTPDELRSLFSLLRPKEASEILQSNRQMLTSHLEGVEENLTSLQDNLEKIAQKEMPRFSRIILYIDDLDRCPPQTVVQVLQAVHLLLCFPLFTVVVAVDARWISRALRRQFPTLLVETGMSAVNSDATVGAGANSHDYLEKIFQIPYWVRPIDSKGAMRYVKSLVEPDVRGAGNQTRVNQNPAFKRASDDKQPGSGLHPDTSTKIPLIERSEEQEATSLQLTNWEADALERFAPLVGATPRRLIRFVNVYRLIKTGLPQGVLERFVGDKGESETYRALIAQLAIVTGAPNAAQDYFSALAALGPAEPIEKVRTNLADDSTLEKGAEHEIIQRILASARDWDDGQLKVCHLLDTAPIARRYSFTARSH